MIVNGDHDGDGYIVALDRKTGQEHLAHRAAEQYPELFRAAHSRLDGRRRWSSPADNASRATIPTTASCTGSSTVPTEQFVASPSYTTKRPICRSLRAGSRLPYSRDQARRPWQSQHEKIAWRHDRGAPMFLRRFRGDWFYVVSEGGVATASKQIRKILWQERIGEHHASLVSAEINVYFLNDKGEMNVVKASRNSIAFRRTKSARRRLLPRPSARANSFSAARNIFLRRHLFEVNRLPRWRRVGQLRTDPEIFYLQLQGKPVFFNSWNRSG